MTFCEKKKAFCQNSKTLFERHRFKPGYEKLLKIILLKNEKQFYSLLIETCIRKNVSRKSMLERILYKLPS